MTNFYKTSLPNNGQVAQQQPVDLKWAGTNDEGGCRFTGELAPISRSESHCGYRYNFRQDFAIKVHETWLTDPVSGKGGFNVGSPESVCYRRFAIARQHKII
jgi:hypothetical protein